ncbi:hypothetical protein HAX54_047178 [Datura stramonium]|uniref:Uncharacterized protein n=1 Tax=Datura stramonium TaxID=4076 RepID=A0ABS8SSS9_DATST|nr:hypothetical protein [Datura stramonium]
MEPSADHKQILQAACQSKVKVYQRKSFGKQKYDHYVRTASQFYGSYVDLWWKPYVQNRAICAYVTSAARLVPKQVVNRGGTTTPQKCTHLVDEVTGSDEEWTAPLARAKRPRSPFNKCPCHPPSLKRKGLHQHQPPAPRSVGLKTRGLTFRGQQSGPTHTGPNRTGPHPLANPRTLSIVSLSRAKMAHKAPLAPRKGQVMRYCPTLVREFFASYGAALDTIRKGPKTQQKQMDKVEVRGVLVDITSKALNKYYFGKAHCLINTVAYSEMRETKKKQ